MSHIREMKIKVKRLEVKELLTLETEAQNGLQLRADIISKLCFSPRLEVIYKGLFIKNDESVLHLENQTVLIIRWRSTDLQEPEPPASPPLILTGNSPNLDKICSEAYVLRSADAVFNLLHCISQQDPYILSYLAVNPNKAREEVLKYLSAAEFKRDTGLNSIISVDENNIRYLAETSGFMDLERVRDLYYLFNKDIRQTLDTLLLERK